MLAVTLGANAAMEFGSSNKALKFYQTVLKFDPDHKEVRKQYRGLKKVIKLLKNSEEKLTAGYNRKAMEFVDQCLSAIRGLDVDSPIFRSIIQLKLCRVQSGLGLHEEAIENCDKVVEQRSTPVPGLFIDPRLVSEAYLGRAEVSMKDFDYDGAVSDYRTAINLVQGEAQHEIRQKLREADHAKSQWNGGEPDHFHPNGRPPQRDNIKILDLPVNLGDSTQEVKCKWLKKQYKKMVLKWHPDKYKGNAKRGERKMRTVNESKEQLAQE